MSCTTAGSWSGNMLRSSWILTCNVMFTKSLTLAWCLWILKCRLVAGDLQLPITALLEQLLTFSHLHWLVPVRTRFYEPDRFFDRLDDAALCWASPLDHYQLRQSYRRSCPPYHCYGYLPQHCDLQGYASEQQASGCLHFHSNLSPFLQIINN